jgi:hypothetical protein
MMDAASFSETSVNSYQARRLKIPEDSRLHTYIYVPVLPSTGFVKYFLQHRFHNNFGMQTEHFQLMPARRLRGAFNPLSALTDSTLQRLFNR